MNRHLRNLAAISLGAAVCAAANLAHAQSMDALYEKAKLEKELIIYGGGPASLYEGPARAFEQKYLSLIHISEPTRLGMISYAVFCLKKKKKKKQKQKNRQ